MSDPDMDLNIKYIDNSFIDNPIPRNMFVGFTFL